MRVDGNYGGTLEYEPNSYGEWQEQPDFAEPPLALEGAADHWDYRVDDDDYYTQPGLLFRLIGPEKQQVLFDTPARAMGDAPKEVKIRHIGKLLEGRPGLRRGCGRCAWYSAERRTQVDGDTNVTLRWRIGGRPRHRGHPEGAWPDCAARCSAGVP